MKEAAPLINQLFWIIIFGLLLSFSGSAQHIQEFLKEDGSYLIHVMPVKLKGKNHKSTLEFTLSDTLRNQDTVVVLFGAYQKRKDSIQSLHFADEKESYELTLAKSLVSRSENKYHYYRFEAYMPYEDFKKWIHFDKISLETSGRDQNVKLKPNGKGKKRLQAIRRKLETLD